MNLKEIFKPTKRQVKVISIVSFLLSLFIPDFGVIGGRSPPIFIRIISGKADASALLIILMGFAFFWGLLYIISRIGLFLMKINYHKTKFSVSLIISISAGLIYSITYANLYDKTRMFPGQGITFIEVVTLLIISSLVVFVLVYSVYSIIEAIAKRNQGNYP